MTNEVLQAILSRRSCKKYKADPVPAEIIDAVIEAGLYAANGMAKQSAVILAVTDKATRDKLSALNAKYDPLKRKDPFYGAPAVLPVIADKSVPTQTFHVQTGPNYFIVNNGNITEEKSYEGDILVKDFKAAHHYQALVFL